MDEVHHPPHNIGQFLPIRRLDIEREQHPLKLKPAHLKGIDPFRVAKHAAQEILRPQQLEQGLADIHRLLTNTTRVPLKFFHDA
jgi:hypothetical protein